MYKDTVDIVMQKEIDFNISIRSSREFQNKTFIKVGDQWNIQNGCRQPFPSFAFNDSSKEQKIVQYLYMTIKSNIYYLHNHLNVHTSVWVLSAVTSDKARLQKVDPRIVITCPVYRNNRPVADLKRGGSFKNIPIHTHTLQNCLVMTLQVNLIFKVSGADPDFFFKKGDEVLKNSEE